MSAFGGVSTPRGHRRRDVRHPVVYRRRLRSLADADADALFRNKDYDDLILLCAAFPSLKCSQTILGVIAWQMAFPDPSSGQTLEQRRHLGNDDCRQRPLYFCASDGASLTAALCQLAIKSCRQV